MITLAQYTDILLHAIKVKEGEIVKDLFALQFFQDDQKYNTDGKANVTEEALKSVSDIRSQTLQSLLLRTDGFLASPWLEIATNHFVIATRLSILSSFADHKSISTLSPNMIVNRLGCSVQQLIVEVWEAMNSLIISFLRMFSSLQQGRWCVSTLVLLLSNYRRLSVLADEMEQKSFVNESKGKSGKHVQRYLEECARQLNKAFSACVSDRTSEEDFSRKWATYEIVGLVFRGYFKLRSLGLCRNILRAIGAADLPDFEKFPRAQRVTFKYYVGVLAFLNEDYATAEIDLDYAFQQCHKEAYHNQEMILRYLVPCRLLRGMLFNDSLLRTFPKLSILYGELIKAIKTGNVRSYDSILQTPTMERRLVRIGTYLAVERAREVCLRGLLKRVYRSKGCNSRITLLDFHRALQFVGVELELLETEWLVASQIAKGYIRGYISHSHMTAVLSSQNPFPKLNTISLVTIS